MIVLKSRLLFSKQKQNNFWQKWSKNSFKANVSKAQIYKKRNNSE